MPEILVIEDNPQIREIYAVLMHDWGYRVRSVASTGDAIGLIRSGYTPDAIVADYNLGGGDTGIAAIRGVEELLGRPVPAVVISGEESLPDVRLPTIRKPIAQERLKDAVAGLLEAPPIFLP